MTVARFNARGRTRLLLFLAVVCCGLIFVIVFHNNQQENDELRQLELRCQQQLGAIQAQKSRVENSLNAEKLQSDHFTKELEDEKTKVSELTEKLKVTDQKFKSLHQECKFSQTTNEDKQKECEKTRLKQAEEIDAFKEEIKELKHKFETATKEKEKEISTLKFQLEKHENVEGVDESVVAQLKLRNLKLEQELSRAKATCEKYGFQQFESSSTSNAVKSKPLKVINFSDQVSITPNIYRVVNNSTVRSPITNSKYYYSSSVKADHHKFNNNKIRDTTQDNGIINSVENFQIAQQPILGQDDNNDKLYKNKEDEGNVLAQPQLLNKGSTTTTTESPKAGSNKNDETAKLVAPPILQAPTVKESKSSTPVKKERRLPEGVVPVPETSWLNNNKETQDNRYSNVIDENAVGQDLDQKNADNLNFLNANEQENLAHEVPDTDFNIDEKKVNAENPGGMGEDKIDNNAEEDTNMYDTNKDVFNTNNNKDTGVFHNNRKSGNSDTKLRNEVAGDHGKEGDHYADDLHIEGQNEEEGDMGDYDDPNVMKEGPGPAERNK
uniref:CSON000073 protein n=2 Tax=Culicoides sonorensis TaxID=179676 RepID=A0A336LT61_CULSO